MLEAYATRHLESNLFAKLACGRVTGCPFEGIASLGESVYQLFEKHGEEPRKRVEEQSSPPEFRLLGAFPRQAGHPEQDLPSFAPEVRVGLGIKMQRLLAVYPRRRRWRLREQENPDAHLAYWEQGADNNNHASVKEFLETEEEQLEQSVHKGPALRLTESEARIKKVHRLVVASVEQMSQGTSW